MNNWTWLRWWLVIWTGLAVVFVIQCVNRLTGVTEFYDGKTGLIDRGTWNLLIGSIESGLLALGLLFIAVLPAVWQLTARRRPQVHADQAPGVHDAKTAVDVSDVLA